MTATDLVLTVTQMLRKKGVVGKFVEFFGEGLNSMTLADRATIGNMSPEYGATCGFFPVDAETIKYLTTTGRTEERIALVEAYTKAQGMWREVGLARPGFHRHAGAGPGRRRAVHGRAEAAGGPHRAGGHPLDLRRGAGKGIPQDRRHLEALPGRRRRTTTSAMATW